MTHDSGPKSVPMLRYPAARLRRGRPTGASTRCSLTLCRCEQRPHPARLYAAGGEGPDPVHQLAPAMAQLLQAADRLHPPKHLSRKRT
jgi:hypothetical protein